MKTITIYWSNICVLHRMEQQMLAEIQKQLAPKRIALDIHYFGIGYPERMSTRLARKDTPLPDLIVSTDLEVFEDRRIFDAFCHDLYPLKEQFPLAEAVQNSSFAAWEHLLPFLVIPLVLYTTLPQNQAPQSFAELQNRTGVCFGGMDNSGIRAVLKALCEQWGEQQAFAFAQNSCLTQMPVNAFRQVQTGQTDIGIVPSIYTRTANGNTHHRIYPAEGAIALPSYIAMHKNAPIDEALEVMSLLLSDENCAAFVEQGDLYCPLAKKQKNAWVSQHQHRFLYPSPQWFARVSPEQFGNAYELLMSAATVHK